MKYFMLVLLLLFFSPAFGATDFDALPLLEDCSSVADMTMNISGSDTATIISSSGNCTRSGSGQPGSGWWNAQQYGPNIAISATASDGVGTASGQYMMLWVLIQNPGSAGAQDGYNCQFSFQDEEIRVNRFDNSAFGAQTLCGTLSSTLDSNDRIACEKINNVIKAYVYHGAGWVEECSLTDSTYSGTGYVGAQINTQQLSFDNVRADTLEATPSPNQGQALWPFIQ